MARPCDFQAIRLTEQHEEVARAQAREFADLEANPFAWAGLAAEHALVASINAAGKVHASLATDYHHDLELWPLECGDLAQGVRPTTVEVKTRVASAGWTDPGRFQFIGVPTHEGRAPVKDVDVVLFCWWSADAPRRLWVLGRLLGREEFERRAVFYREDEPTPRGGPAPKGGAYMLDVMDLRPVPRGLFQTEETTCS